MFDDWRIAYAKQGKADLLAREQLLRNTALPVCQQLHFLQMACEKICKAFLCGQGTDPSNLEKSHGYSSGPLPVIARQYFRRQRNTEAGWILQAIATLSRKIELLAPAVKAGGTHPANCEYPWRRADGVVLAPAEYRFDINLARDPGGTNLLKILQTAADELASQASRATT